MEPTTGSGNSRPEPGEIRTIFSTPDSSSFTALLGLPSPQAVELLVNEDFPVPSPIFPSNVALVDRASQFSVYASPESTTIPSAMKQESLDSDSRPNSSSPSLSKSGKRKEREKKVKDSDRKSKKVASNAASEASGEKLPYVHVRARRGQATDNHSLAERARREKINARMKLLQELVPGCNKISGRAMVLDEIINHVQALQRHVEFLSMKLAAVNTGVDFNFDSLIAAESGSTIDNSYPGMFDPCAWSEGQINGYKQHQHQHQHQQLLHVNGLHQPSSWVREDDTINFITPDNSLLSYVSPENSASLHSSQLKMEL